MKRKKIKLPVLTKEQEAEFAEISRGPEGDAAAEAEYAAAEQSEDVINLTEDRIVVLTRTDVEGGLYHTIAQNRKTGDIRGVVRFPSGRRQVVRPRADVQYVDVQRQLEDMMDEGLFLYCWAERLPVPTVTHWYPPEGTGEEVLEWLLKFDLVEIRDMGKRKGGV